MVNYLAMVEQNDGSGLLLFLLLGLLLIMFLAYLPRKEKPEKHDEDIDLADDNEDTDVSHEAEPAPDYDAVKKKLYSAITAVFDDTLNNAGNIIIYSAADKNRFDEPIVSVITILLPNNMLYIKFDYKLDSKHLVQKYGDCVVKLDTEKQSADIYTELLHPDSLKDIIELTVALNALVDCGMTAVLEV